MDIQVGELIKFPGYVLGSTPDQVYQWFDDFNEFAVGSDGVLGGWINTTTEAGTTGSSVEGIVCDGSAGGHGVLKLLTDVAADDYTQIQGPEVVKLEAGLPTVFKCRVLLQNTGLAEWLVGLAITESDPMAAGAYFLTDSVCFTRDTGQGVDTVLLRATKDSTAAGDLETDTATFAAVDATWMNLAFYYDGDSKIIGYKDGTQIGEITTNIPDNEYLAPIACINNSTAATGYMYIDYIGVWQQRA